MPKDINRLRQFARNMRSNQTNAEAALWETLRGRRLDNLKFSRQVPLEGYIVDFVSFDCTLIMEVEYILQPKGSW